ncbi:dTDP-4-dehydrorhamnose reductase [candidate division FCPU426 bacterium]|nr:dTDP-4-dehydrorhamnose reductase [candidate division FCPU426 bacterium]
MKILVVGADGQVGQHFLQVLGARHAVSGTALQAAPGLEVLDMQDKQAVEAKLKAERPEHVILTAALTHVDQCEEAPEKSEAVNVRGTENVADACRAIGAGMTFFSTDYVFDGQGGPYREEDTPRPLSVYGRHKLEGEHIVARVVARHLIIRTMFVFSYLPGSVNFFMQLLRRAQRGEPITVPDDQLGNPTQAWNLAAAAGELMEQNHWGVYHVTGTTRISKADFARRVLEKLGFDPCLVTAVQTAVFRQKARRPLNSGLLTDKTRAALKKNTLWDLDRALRHTLEQMASAGATA